MNYEIVCVTPEQWAKQLRKDAYPERVIQRYMHFWERRTGKIAGPIRHHTHYDIAEGKECRFIRWFACDPVSGVDTEKVRTLLKRIAKERERPRRAIQFARLAPEVPA